MFTPMTGFLLLFLAGLLGVPLLLVLPRPGELTRFGLILLWIAYFLIFTVVTIGTARYYGKHPLAP